MESISAGFGEDIDLPNSLGEGIVLLAGGGGSIAECVIGAFDGTTGSGSGAISSSADAVSIVICVVDLTLARWV